MQAALTRTQLYKLLARHARSVLIVNMEQLQQQAVLLQHIALFPALYLLSVLQALSIYWHHKQQLRLA